MPDIIHLLPDSIANQIAAGEVIQRPASVVKELIENSLDAGATHITLSVKDAGRTFIQVIDNGMGMSGTDLRLAFERHATSKIKTAEDLFALTTRGFRGEALPSIAAISHVEVKSRREEDELGSLLLISGSKVEKQEMIAAGTGTSITVKNIFFNVPARRKFLKSNETERRNIFTEFERIVLVNPSVEFTLIENGVETLHLPKTGLRQRIVQMEGKNANQQLIEINEETSLGRVFGYVSRPEFAKKGKVNQFFFVNNRFIRHPYFHKAVTTAFDPLIAANEKPSYYIYFQVDPDTIDVNIHPTKTEVKFENEQALWQILMVTVKESLGKFNAIPTIDFDREDAPDIPVYNPSRASSMPRVSIDHGYNPFQSHRHEASRPVAPAFGWEQLYSGFEKDKEMTAGEDEDNPIPVVIPERSNASGDLPNHDEYDENTASFKPAGSESPATFSKMGGDENTTSLFKSAGVDRNMPETDFFPEHYQYKQKYILTSVKSGLMMIDQRRAHVRILFEKYLEQIRNKKGISQRVLFPEVLDLSASEAAALPAVMDDLESLGFELGDLGGNSYAIQAVPSEIVNADPASLVRSVIGKSMETGSDVKSEIQESIALSLANLTAISYGSTLTTEEMLLIVSQLFATPSPSYTPDGQTIISVIPDADIEKKMQ